MVMLSCSDVSMTRHWLDIVRDGFRRLEYHILIRNMGARSDGDPVRLLIEWAKDWVAGMLNDGTHVRRQLPQWEVRVD